MRWKRLRNQEAYKKTEIGRPIQAGRHACHFSGWARVPLAERAGAHAELLYTPVLAPFLLFRLTFYFLILLS
jgi:hypothetical protein